jgi:hypothetical protein
MSFQRRARESATLCRYVFDQNVTCIFFVHGLAGNNHSYWANVKNYLLYDDRLGSVDFFFWGYKSSKSVVIPKTLSIGSEERLSTIEELASALAYTIKATVNECGYTKVSLFAHSLGGIISLLACEKMVASGASQILSICVNATPLRPPLLAKIATSMQFGLNPQIRALANLKTFSLDMHRAVTFLVGKNIHVRYMHCIGDYLVKLYSEVPFSERVSCAGPHNWMENVKGYQDPTYSHVVRFVMQCACR